MENGIADRLKRLRDQHEISQMEFALAMGVNRMTINNYETGKRVPDLDFIIKAADYFSVSLEYISGRSEYRNSEDLQYSTERVERLTNVILKYPQTEAQQMLLDLTELLERAVKQELSEPMLTAVTNVIKEFGLLLAGYDFVMYNMTKGMDDLIALKISSEDAKKVCSDKVKALSEFTLLASKNLLSYLNKTTVVLEKNLSRVIEEYPKK